MAVYCFPDPTKPEQLEMIRALGYVENVIRDIRWESPDHVKLSNVRREAMANLKANPKLSGIFSSYIHTAIVLDVKQLS